MRNYGSMMNKLCKKKIWKHDEQIMQNGGKMSKNDKK